MKVLFVFNHPAPYKVRLFNELSKYIDLTVFFERSKSKDRPNSFYNCNVYNFKNIIGTKGYFGNENSCSNELKKYLKLHKDEFDLIIMNGYSTISEIKAIRYLNRHKKTFIFYINGGVVKKEFFLKKILKKHLLKGAKYFMTPGSKADPYLLQYNAKQDSIFHYTYSTIYDKDVVIKPLNKQDKQIIRNKFNLPEGKIFVNPSQFIERKNNIELIKIFKDRNETLLLIGSGPEKDKYLQFIATQNIKNVIIMDFVKKDVLFEILKSCDCLITLSKEDIYGHTINEGLAMGLPVIASDQIISAKQYIKDGYNGFVVDLENKRFIHDAIDNIGKINHENIAKSALNNTIEQSVKDHIRIFNELLK